MLLIGSPVPSICITPAPSVKTEPDYYSPFKSAEPDIDDDGYRANHLSLPPSTESSPWYSSPLRPPNRPTPQGLTRDQFNSLLKASRDTRAKAGAHKNPDLRKELALKNQSPKQLGRRARFLSRVSGSSYMATICVPEITIESPGPDGAYFSMSPFRSASGYSAPESSAEISENLVAVDSPANPPFDGQIEPGQLPAEIPRTSLRFPPSTPTKSRYLPPSLDEILAHLKRERIPSGLEPRSPLSFLAASNQSSGSIDDQTHTIPARSLPPNDDMLDTTFSRQVNSPRLFASCGLTPKSERVDLCGVVAGPTVQTVRDDTARDMIVILRRRSSPLPSLGRHACTWTSTAARKCSAPTEMQCIRRSGFDHVAALPQGGFWN